MNYKSVFKNQNTRFLILKLLSFVPDKLMIKLQYRIKLGCWPNLVVPVKFSEKLQLYKLRYRNSVMGQCVDKHGVRVYIQNKGYENLLVNLLGVYDNADEINFNLLPNKFVIKTTDGGGGR
ncbi:MAG: ATP-grasp fold amidoligase family protein, partial [Tannerellaceae bacterium]